MLNTVPHPTPPTPPQKTGSVAGDELINHKHHSADSCQCRRSTPTPQLHSSDCMCEHIPGKISPLLTRKHTPHTHWRTRRVQKLAKSDIYLPLRIYCYAVRTSLDVSLMHTEEFLRAKSLYSPVSHSSGPFSLLIVCRGWEGFKGACGIFFFFFNGVAV